MLTLRERFEAKYVPEPTSGCWLWIGAKNSSGYGSFNVGNKLIRGAHQVAWELHRGPLLIGMHLLHRCDNRACVNPDHLFLGDNAANVADRVAKGRSGTARGSRQGLTHLTEEQAAIIFADDRPHQVIASDYGISKHSVWAIKNGKTWLHVTQGALDSRGVAKGERHGISRLTITQVIAIRADGRSQSQIAADYSISQSLVSMIKGRVIWRHVEE